MSSRQPTEEEIAALEAQLKQLRVEDVLLENIVSVLNLSFRRCGLVEGTADERDPDQVRLGIDSVTALLPLVEQSFPRDRLSSLREALSQLQLAYVRMSEGEEAAADAGAPEPPDDASGGAAPGGDEPDGDQGGSGGPSGDEPSNGPSDEQAKPPPGPAQRSGRLWVPGD
jgi:hypothetical protein